MGQSRASKKTRFTATSVPLTSIQTKQVRDVHRDVTGGLPSFDTETGEIVSFEDDIGEELEGYSDAAEILADKLNTFLIEHGEFTLFQAEDIKEYLSINVTPKQLSAHMTNEFGKGMLMGDFLRLRDFFLEIENEEDPDEDTF
jgi:hypothetical protein